MPVVVPPRRTQLLFLAMGRRLDPRYRPWVAEELQRPDHARRRLGPALGFQALFLVVPQSAFALAAHSWLRLAAPLGLVLFDAVYVVVVVRRGKPMTPAQRERLLAYHGVTSDGTLVEPASAWDSSPLGKAVLALLCAQVLLFSSGVAIAYDRLAARRACQVLAGRDAAALAAVVGRPAPGLTAASGQPSPLVPPGTALLFAREVGDGVTGLHVVAAYVRDASGQRRGPAVWRVFDPSTLLNRTFGPSISAQDDLARQITPSAGYAIGSSEDPAIAKARSCSRDAA